MDIQKLLAEEERSAIERWVRSHAKSAYLGKGRALCRVLGTYNMVVSTRDFSLSPHMLLDGFWEMWVTQLLARKIRRGMSCIDVGANCGYYTLLLADMVGPHGRVQAWEPQPTIAEALQLSINANGFAKRVELITKAAGAWAETRPLYCDRDYAGNASLMPPEREQDVHLTVECERLDRAGCSADFIKIDAEGAEHAIWEGMTDLLPARPAILMELSPGRCLAPVDLLDKIESAGYPLRRVNEDAAVVAAERSAILDSEYTMLWLERDS